jgi:acyl carrier protein
MKWNSFIQLLADELQLDALDLKPDTRLKEDLGVDSFMKVSVCIYFEELLDTTYEDADIIATLTVYQLYNLLKGV